VSAASCRFRGPKKQNSILEAISNPEIGNFTPPHNTANSIMATSSTKTEWEGIVMEAIATMIYVFICCGVVASTSNVTFDELNSPRLVVIALARK